jgi:hypothetical protein
VDSVAGPQSLQQVQHGIRAHDDEYQVTGFATVAEQHRHLGYERHGPRAKRHALPEYPCFQIWNADRLIGAPKKAKKNPKSEILFANLFFPLH